jgi:hypothetical protein
VSTSLRGLANRCDMLFVLCTWGHPAINLSSWHTCGTRHIYVGMAGVRTYDEMSLARFVEEAEEHFGSDRLRKGPAVSTV